MERDGSCRVFHVIVLQGMNWFGNTIHRQLKFKLMVYGVVAGAFFSLGFEAPLPPPVGYRLPDIKPEVAAAHTVHHASSEDEMHDVNFDADNLRCHRPKV